MAWPEFIEAWVERDSRNWAPVPRIKWGYVRGPSVRWEKAGAQPGTDKFLTAFANKWIRNVGAAEAGLPADYGITHLQKQSRFGILRVAPFCFYVWFQIRPQKEKKLDDGTIVTVPGSELCPTFRIGKGRWDAGAKSYIRPTLQAGLHWD